MMDATRETSFEERLRGVAARMETILADLLKGETLAGEIARPSRLLEAMRHGVLGGGKRIRPFLVAESAALFGADETNALHTGAAFELLHCYSLVHDDLPAMDDDATRRGRPTVHLAFDEATAILAGDTLLTLAFDVLARESTHRDPEIRVALVQCLARAAGIGGMAGGQMLDLEAEGRFAADEMPKPLDLESVECLQRMKTGALLAACCDAGAILGNANAIERQALADYARALGLAFQIADDLLDREGDAALAGKAVGKDAAHGKATFVSLLGADGAHAKLQALLEQAQGALAPFGGRAGALRECAAFVASRKN